MMRSFRLRFSRCPLNFSQPDLADAVEHQVREFSRIGRNLDENMRLI
jgi:hypothetical protein